MSNRRFSMPASRSTAFGGHIPSSPTSPSSSTFVHRDIFASVSPGGPTSVGRTMASSRANSVESPYSTPNRFQSPRRRNQPRDNQTPPPGPDESLDPNASKLERLDQKLGSYPLLGWLETRTGIRKVYLASGLLLCLLLLIFRGTGLSAVSIGIGFLYPLHMSLKTIENCTSLFEEISGDNRHKHTQEEYMEKRGEILGQLRKWLVYWVVYGLFNMFESLSDFSLSWLPIYHPLKLLFLLWCFLPQYQGSQLVFDILVRPVLIRHESAIEASVETAQQAALAGVGRVGRVVRQKSIQLSKAIQLTGQQLLTPTPSSGSPISVRSRVAAIESGQFNQPIDGLPHIHEGEREHEHEVEQDQVNQAFRAASRVAERNRQ